MKNPFRLPVPFAVLAAACTTGCCSFCIRTPGPEFWDYDFEPSAAKVETHAESAESDSHAEFAESAELDFDLGLVDNGGNGEQSPEVEVEPLPVESASARLPSVTVEAYPDADEVSVFEWEETLYETNGTYTTTWTTLSKILTQRGLENNRTFSFSNNDFYGSTTVLVARVHSPDGTARDVDLAANLAEATDTSSLASNIHDPNDKTFTLAFPDLKVGDTVELVMRRTAKRPRCEGVYSDYLTFESDHPILFQGARITGPASMPLRSRAFRDAGPVELTHAAHTNEAAGTVTEVWTAENVPRYFAEPDMPPAYDCTARLLLSTAPDWESLSRWYARLCAPHLAATNAAMAAKVAELVAAATSAATGDPSDDAPATRPSDWETYGIRPSAEEDATGETFGRMFVPAIPPPAGEHATPDDWKAYFSTLGVRWPEGSSVELAADGSGVLVRNTFPELDVLASRHGTFDPRRLPTVFVDARGLAPLQLRADGSTVVRPADRVVPPGAAQDRELVRLLETPGRSRSPFPPGVEVDAKAPIRALKTVADAIAQVGFLPVTSFRIAGRPFVQWDNSASAPEVEIDFDHPDAPIPGFLFFGVEAIEHAWHPFPFSDGAPFPEGRHDRHVDAAGAAKAWRAAREPGKPDPKVVVFCDPDATCGRLHELMVSLQGAGAEIGVCLWDGNVFSPVANRIRAANAEGAEAGSANNAHAESAEDAGLSGGDTPTARPPELTVVQSSREAVLANGFGWAYTFQLPGASAEETEERVGKPLERAFATIEGIRNVFVRIQEGSGIAVAEFAPDSDRTASKTAVADAVEAARRSMPADAVVAGPVFSAVPRAAVDLDPVLPPEIASVLKALNETMVEEIDWREESLVDVVEKLSDLSKGSGTNGIDFVLVLPTDDSDELWFGDENGETACEPEEEIPDPPRVVTVKAAGVSLHALLDMVVETTGLKYRIEPSRVVLLRDYEAAGAIERAQNAPGTPAEPPSTGGEAALPPATRAAVVRALFDFVSREVRYMGAMAESEAPGYEPHDVSLTFANRYGVCRDKAALLVAMLRMAGIDAWPVLINVGPRKDAQVPQPYFNHAIVAADSGDPANPYLLMDPTSETTRSLLPEYLCEMSYLVARDEGETIRETPPLPVEGNLLQANTVFTLNGDASADVSTTMSFAGVNDAAYRGYFASIPRDSIRAFFERVLQGVPGAVLTRWELHPAPEELRRSPEPLVATVEYAVAEAARGAEGGRTALLDVPGLPARLAIASRVVGDLGLEKRRFPLVTDYPCGFEETVELHLPDGVSIGAAPAVAFPAGSHAEFAESAELDLNLGLVDNGGNGGNGEQSHGVPQTSSILFLDIPTNAPSGAPGRYRSLKLLRSRYSPEEYQLLRESRVAEERAGRAPILLQGEGVQRMFEGRAFGDGLSNVLSRAVEPAPVDDTFLEWQRTTVDVSRAPEEWTVETTTRRRILTYAGQRKAGDVTLRWNPATTDLRVTNACVVLPDGTATPVDPKLDLFEGDQEWVAGAPRYPAGKIATVSFPKLAPGCAVEYTVIRRAHDRDLFSFSQTLGSLGSFGELSVTVVGTNETARSFVVDDPYWKTIADRFPVETASTETSTTFTVRGGGPGSQVVAEPNMPPLHRLAPVLRASSQTAPERAAALAARMWALSDPAVQTNATALARSLVATNATVREAFVALRDWCAVNLREAGPAYWDLPLSALSSADATLAARYGHEADLRILQLALARALGRDAEISIRFYDASWNADPSLRSPADVPANPATFDTIAIGFSGHVFDGATQYAHPLADRNRELPALVWRPDRPAPDDVVLSRPSFGYPFRNWGELLGSDGVRTRYDIDVRTNGSARVRVAVEHGGDAFEAFRKRYEQILPEERRRDAQRRVAAFAQSARLVGEVETETPPDGPCVLRFEAEVSDFAQPCGNGLAFRDPGLLPVSPPAARRRFPFRRAAASAEMTESVVHLPEGWVATCRRPSIGSDCGRDAGVDVRLQCTPPPAPGGTMFLSSWRVLEPVEFPAESYEGFLASSLGLRGPDAATIRIHPPEPVDSRFLIGSTPEKPALFGLRLGDRPELDEGGTNASFRTPFGRFFLSNRNVSVPKGRLFRYVPDPAFLDRRFDFVAAVVDDDSGQVVRIFAHIDVVRPDGTPAPDWHQIAEELFDVFGACETTLDGACWDSGRIWWVRFVLPDSVGIAFNVHDQFGTDLDLFRIEDSAQIRKGFGFPAHGHLADWMGPHPFADLYETNAVRRASRESSSVGPDAASSEAP